MLKLASEINAEISTFSSIHNEKLSNSIYLILNIRLTFLFTSKIRFSCHLCRNRSNGSKNNGLGLIILNNGL
jgi:hypothetical protein